MKRIAIIILIVAAVVGSIVAIRAMRDDGSPSPGLPLAAAAATASTAIRLGDNLGHCPFGEVDALSAALPEGVPLSPTVISDSKSTRFLEGQVFSGGEQDITYCALESYDYETGPISGIRFDVAPSTVDFDEYLTEEFDGWEPDDFSTAASFMDGTMQTGCFNFGTSHNHCIAAWQADGLFVSTTLTGPQPIEAGIELDIAKAMIPFIVQHLADNPIDCQAFRPECSES